MLELYIISNIISFVLMTIFTKHHYGQVLVMDLLLNFVASITPILNIVVLILMFLSLRNVSDIGNKRVF